MNEMLLYHRNGSPMRSLIYVRKFLKNLCELSCSIYKGESMNTFMMMDQMIAGCIFCTDIYNQVDAVN